MTEEKSEPRIVWGVSIPDDGEDYYYTEIAFTTEELAKGYAEGCGGFLQEIRLFDRPVEQKPYYVLSAEVYPDGTIFRHKKTEQWDEPGPKSIEQSATHEAEQNKWVPGGHQSGHCGIGVVVSGGDLEALEVMFEVRIQQALEKSDGMCPVCGSTPETGYRATGGRLLVKELPFSYECPIRITRAGGAVETHFLTARLMESEAGVMRVKTASGKETGAAPAYDLLGFDLKEGDKVDTEWATLTIGPGEEA